MSIAVVMTQFNRSLNYEKLFHSLGKGGKGKYWYFNFRNAVKIKFENCDSKLSPLNSGLIKFKSKCDEFWECFPTFQLYKVLILIVVPFDYVDGCAP